MVNTTKNNSPFYPNHPVPSELFVGREEQINKIKQRGIGQVAAGKPITMFLEGEYGIGKSSLAGYVQSVAEKEYGLHCIYATLGGAKTLDDVGEKILEGTIRSGAFEKKGSDTIRTLFADYIKEVSLFGVTIHTDKLRQDASISSLQLLPFLGGIYARLLDIGTKGIFLVLDEINGITSNPEFAHLIKGIVDTNALSRPSLPLLLMLCGVEEKRREMIEQHQPVDRLFHVIDINPMNKQEIHQFFSHSCAKAEMQITDEALDIVIHYSAGFPKIMHLIGDAAYWIDQDNIIDRNDALKAVLIAAEEVGQKYVHQQVYKALRSADYHSILKKIAHQGPNVMSFKKTDVISGLTDTEKKKFNNFLQKMKSLKVLRAGDVQGEYVFTMRMVRLYIWLQSLSPRKQEDA